MNPGPIVFPHGVLAHSRVWQDGQVVDDDVTPDEMVAVAKDEHSLVWLDLLNPSSDALGAILSDLGLPETAVEDALAPHERSKLVRHDSHLFFTAYATLRAPSDADGASRVTLHRISGVVTPMALVTIRLSDAVDMRQVLARWTDNADLLAQGSGALVYGLLDYLVDGHFTTIQDLDDILEELEDELFDQRATDAAFQRKVFGIRKDLVQVRRVVLPMREVVNGVRRHSINRAPLDPWFDDLYDHVLRATEWSDSLRDVITSIFETNLSLQDARLNTVMKKLAAWAAIIAVPTLITSWYGQNIPYPGFNDPSGLAWSLGLIAVCVGVLLAVFKRWDWL